MPWVQLDNVVVGALIGLVGIVCGTLISGWSQRRVEHEHSRLPELILAFDAMKTELERLPSPREGPGGGNTQPRPDAGSLPSGARLGP